MSHPARSHPMKSKYYLFSRWRSDLSLANEPFEAGHSKFGEKLFNLRQCRLQVDIGLKPALPVHDQPGMIGIDLSRMNVKNHRPRFLEYLSSHHPNHSIREETKISAAKKTNRLSKNICDAQGKLEQSSRVTLDPVWPAIVASHSTVPA